MKLHHGQIKKNQNLYNEKLDDLFVNFNTDKGTSVKWDGKKINTHGYSAHYEKYLAWREETGILQQLSAALEGPPSIRFFDLVDA